MCADSVEIPKKQETRTVLVPYLPLEYNLTLRLAKPFAPLGKHLVSIFNYLPEHLYAAEIYVEPEVYAGVVILTFALYMLVLNSILLIFQISPILMPEEKELLLEFQLPVTAFFSGVLAFQVLNYPVLVSRKRAWRTEKYIANVLRHMTIEVRSGATLFEAIQDVAKGDYDVISRDCTEIVNAVNSGLSFEEAMEYIVLKTKCEAFRRVLLQIESAFTSGSNMAEVLVQLSRTYFQEQQVKIQKYGRELEFYSRVFLMITVIMPVMMTIMLSMTALMPVIQLSSQLLYLFFIIIVFFQIMFITYAKEKRPPIYD